MRKGLSKDGAFYDRCWQGWGGYISHSPATRARRRRILGWLRSDPVTDLLDVGCGNGAFLAELAQVRPDLRLAGADISPEVIAADEARHPDMEFSILDLNSQELPRRCQAVTCMEVVEHCADPLAAVARLARAATRSLYLTAPCGPLFPIDARVGHTSHLDPRATRRTLEAEGMRVERCQAWGFPFFNLYKHAINLRPEAMERSFLDARDWGPGKKAVALAADVAFRCNLPFWGYQLFVKATRPAGATGRDRTGEGA